MTTNRRTRVLVVLIAVTSLVAAACGTRMDSDAIVQAAQGAGSGTGVGPSGMADGGDSGFDADVVEGEDDEVSLDSTGEDGGEDSANARRQRGGAAGEDSGDPAGEAGSQRRGSGGGEEIVIGTVGAYSGPGGTALAQGARALQVWAAQVNADGGIDGRPVRVIVMDDGGDAAKARSLMQQLVEERKAVAVVAAMTVIETLNSWKGYVEDKQVPVVGGSCGPEWDTSPMLFRQCPQSPEQIFGTALAGAKYGDSKKFGGLFCSETQSCTFVERQLFADGDAKRAGLDPRYQARISVFQADFTAECMQANNAGVELLMVVADPGTVERVAASCRRQNYTPQYLQVASTVRAGSVTKPGLGNMVLGTPVFPFASLSTPAFREFETAWKRFGGGQEPGPAAVQGWASAKLFEKAARSAGADISRKSIISALRSLKGERLGGLTAPLTFGPKGAARSRCTFVMTGEDGKWKAPQGDKLECW